MRKLSILAIAIIVSIPLGLMAQDEGFYPYSYARLSYVNGSVFVQRTSDLGYEKGEVNLALVQGDKMGTEGGQAEIHFGRRNYLRLSDNTKVEFAVLPQEGDEHIKLHITEGSAYLRVSYLAADKGIEVHTPDASFYVLEEGLYRFDVRLDLETEVFVREGSLEAAGADGSVMVREKETLTAADGRLAGNPEYSYSRNDSFDEWNGSRDAQLSARSERQNLPSDLEEYEEELDQNGQWVYERPYGNVWVPNVSHADWRPYLYGRWVWYPVIGWNWVSSESWGWSVYHYGRWHWRFGLGWYWIPQNHWGPAWVHWWSGSSYIGWCPLSWYNRPVVIVGNHFYDRDYGRDFSAHNRALSVIRRDHLQSPDIARRQVGSGERDRIGRVALKGEQPRIRPAVDNARPQAVEARRALAVRSGSRSAVKSLPPANSVSSSRLRQGAVSQGARTRDRGASVSDPNRNAVSRPAIKDPETGSRVIRSYPSQKVSGNRNENGASENRRAGVAAPVRRSGSEAKENPSRVAPSQKQASASPKSESKQDQQKAKKSESESKGAVIKKGETIKNYPSSARSESAALKPRTTAVAREARQESARASAVYPSRSNRTGLPGSSNSRAITSSPSRSSQSSAGRSQAPALSSRPAASRPAPRLSSPSTSTSRSSSARSSSASPSRTTYSSPSRSSSRSPSYSQPRSSNSAPSRSSGSSSRSISAPKSSGSSSGRSASVAKSGGSSSSRSSSSARSSSSSSRSSSSSSKSGSAKKKGSLPE
ncbi:MAG: hypothetical protein E4H35_01495 [Candidatus Aminicenantes bacterium]|nr:MAG: hypothetical protein E4H35_01495 [Candidatus Aminicenantes bacterium]